MALINTIHGVQESDDLLKVETVFEDDNEVTKATEYYDDDGLVHRSVHVHLKTPIFADGFTAEFG